MPGSLRRVMRQPPRRQRCCLRVSIRSRVARAPSERGYPAGIIPAEQPARRITMKQFLIRAATRNDLVLAVLLMSIIFMMVLPLPTPLVDLLIGINLALTVILLMAAVYLKDVTELSAFPSILLLTTL